MRGMVAYVVTLGHYQSIWGIPLPYFLEWIRIEDELNEELEWMGLPNKTASRIKISKTGNIKDPDKRSEQFEWFKTQAELFQKVFPKYIK